MRYVTWHHKYYALVLYKVFATISGYLSKCIWFKMFALKWISTRSRQVKALYCCKRTDLKRAFKSTGNADLLMSRSSTVASLSTCTGPGWRSGSAGWKAPGGSGCTWRFSRSSSAACWASGRWSGRRCRQPAADTDPSAPRQPSRRRRRSQTRTRWRRQGKSPEPHTPRWHHHQRAENQREPAGAETEETTHDPISLRHKSVVNDFF